MLIKNEEQAIQNIKSNPEEVFTFLYKKSFTLAKRYIVKNSGTSDEAQDIFQDALVILHTKKRTLPEFDFNGNISAYLFTVCKNLWLQRLEQYKKEKQNHKNVSEELYSSNEIISNININEPSTVNNLSNYLNKLGDKCKELLEAFYFLDLNMKEIQSKFSYSSEHSAANQKYKCMERLKKSIPSSFLEHYKNETI